jgi:Transposase DDE domain group 1
MKNSAQSVLRTYRSIPGLAFEHQRLTSFAGIVLFWQLFKNIQLLPRLEACFEHLHRSSIFTYGRIALLLIVHVLAGYRRLRDIRFYKHDPLIKRVLGLNMLPDVSTISRVLAAADERCVQNLRRLCRELIVLRLHTCALARITLDFDGSVFSTKRHAENSAIGFNKKHKGWRSYYPLFCTIAQTGQVFDLLHRPGNVHDSHDAQAFIASCIDEMRLALPGVIIEVRMDSAFFSKDIVSMLINRVIHFTISVPFERLVELKRKIESRKRWTACDVNTAFFEEIWKPKSWDRTCRFLFVRTRETVHSKEPIQLDLFIPQEFGYAHKVILTNKTTSAAQVIDFHNGRGSQESVFAELKTDANMAYIPFNRLVPNKIYLLSAVLAHNLSREFQMATSAKQRNTTFKRIQLWPFHHIGTIRRNIINRAGRLTEPGGLLTLTVSADPKIADLFTAFNESLTIAA